MKGATMRKRISPLVMLGLAICPVLMIAHAVAASPIVYECDLSGNVSDQLAGCANNKGGGYLTSTTALTTNGSCDVTNFCGAKADASTAVIPIEAWSVCRWVDNSDSSSLFIPFKTAQEWQDFRNAAPTLLNGHVNLVHCAVPYSGNPQKVKVTPPFGSCSPIYVTPPNVYGRTGISLYPNPSVPGPAFTCHNGNTQMMSQIQWKANDVEITGRDQSWDKNFRYSPDMVLTSDSQVVDSGAPVTLTWSISPNSPGDTITNCTVSPGGWGPNASGNPRSGSSVITPSGDEQPIHFILSCTVNPNGLTSTSEVDVIVNPPLPPGDGGDGGAPEG